MPLTKKQKQLDKTGDGKITREDLMILRKSKFDKKKKPSLVKNLKNKLQNRVLGKLLRVKDQKRLEKLKQQEGF